MNTSLALSPVALAIRRWLHESRAAATVEFAFVAPAMLIMMGLIVFAGQAFEIQRKVTLTMRTLTDLVTQQTAITSSSTLTYTQILNAASLVMSPYCASGTTCTNLTMVVSEIQTNGSTTGTVIWSAQLSGGVVSTISLNSSNNTVSLPSYVEASPYLILGTVSYNYSPLNFSQYTSTFTQNAITLTDSIYMAPRVSTCISGPNQSLSRNPACP